MDILDGLLDYDPRSLRYAEQKAFMPGDYKIRISNVHCPKAFNAQVISKFDSTLDFYEDYLKDYSSCQLKHPSLGNVCCVKFNDCFRRGQIIKRISPVLYTVAHVDYGCSENYSPEEIYTMVEYLVQDPPCAIKCHLLGDDSLNLNICENYEKKEFYMKIHYFDDGVYYVSLLLENDRLMRASTPDESSVSSNSLSWSLHDQNEKNQILMASVISPYDFTVQLYESLPDMEMFLEKLQDTAREIAEHPSSVVSEISAHEIYIMLNPTNLKWCRVSVYQIVNIGSQVDFSLSNIIAHHPGSYKVTKDSGLRMRDLDTGELLTVYDKRDIFIAPLELKLKSFFGIRCSLPCIVENLQETMAAEYLRRYVGKAVFYKILASDQIVNFVELFDNKDKNIVYKMMSLKLVNRLLIPPIGSAFVVHVDDLLNFYIQLKHETPLLDTVKDYADIKYKQVPACFVLTGDLIMARFNVDASWYRARVLNDSLDENVKVKFIDFGNEAVVKLSDIGLIPKEDLWLINTPELAKKCKLMLPLEVDSQLQEVVDRFKNLTNNGNFEFQYEMIKACLDCATISLYKDYGKDILDELFPERQEVAEAEEQMEESCSCEEDSGECELFKSLYPSDYKAIPMDVARFKLLNE